MIDIYTNETETKKGTRFIIEAKGHANYKEVGSDIVCSAVSMLIQAYAGYLAKTYADYTMDIEAGNTYIEITIPSKKDADTMKAIFSMVSDGLEAIADNYPKNVRIV